MSIFTAVAFLSDYDLEHELTIMGSSTFIERTEFSIGSFFDGKVLTTKFIVEEEFMFVKSPTTASRESLIPAGSVLKVRTKDLQRIPQDVYFVISNELFHSSPDLTVLIEKIAESKRNKSVINDKISELELILERKTIEIVEMKNRYQEQIGFLVSKNRGLQDRSSILENEDRELRVLLKNERDGIKKWQKLEEELAELRVKLLFYEKQTKPSEVISFLESNGASFECASEIADVIINSNTWNPTQDSISTIDNLLESAKNEREQSEEILEIVKLNEQIVDFSAIIERLSNRVGQVQLQNLNLREEIDIGKSGFGKIRALEKENEELHQKIEELTESNSYNVNELRVFREENEKMVALIHELEKRDHHREKIICELEESQSLNSELREDIEKHKDKYNAVVEHFYNCLGTKAGFFQENQGLRNKLEELEEKIEEQVKQLCEVHELREKLRKSEEKCHEVQHHADMLKSDLERIIKESTEHDSEFRKEVQHLLACHVQAEQEILTLKHHNQELEAEEAEIKAELHKTKSENHKLLRNIEAMKEELEISSKICQSSREEEDNTKERLERISRELCEMNDRKKQLEQDEAELKEKTKQLIEEELREREEFDREKRRLHAEVCEAERKIREYQEKTEHCVKKIELIKVEAEEKEREHIEQIQKFLHENDEREQKLRKEFEHDKKQLREQLAAVKENATKETTHLLSQLQQIRDKAENEECKLKQEIEKEYEQIEKETKVIECLRNQLLEYQEQIKQDKREQAELKEKLATVREELRVSQCEENELKAKLQISKNEIKQVEREEQELREKLATTKIELKRSEHEEDELKLKLKVSRDQIAKLTCEDEELKLRLIVDENEITKLKSENEMLIIRLSLEENSVAELRRELSESQCLIDSLSIKIKELEMIILNNMSLSSDITKLKKQYLDLQIEFKKQNEIMDQMVIEKEELFGKFSKVSKSLEEKYSELEVHRRQLGYEVKDKHEENEYLASKTRALEREVESLEGLLEAARKNDEKLDHEIKELKEKLETVEEVKNKLDLELLRAKREVRETKSHHETLQVNIDELRNEVSSVKAENFKLCQLKEELIEIIDKQTFEIEEKQKELVEKSKAVGTVCESEQLQSQVSQLTEKLSKSEVSFREFHQESTSIIEELINKCTKMEQEIRLHTDEKNMLLDKTNHLYAHISKVEAAIEKLQSEQAEKSVSQWSESASTNQEENEQVTEMNGLIKKLFRDIAELENDLNSSIHENAQLKCLLEESDIKTKCLEKLVDELESKIRYLQCEVDDLRKILEKKDCEKDELSLENKRLKSTNHDLKCENQRLEVSNAMLNSENQHLKFINESLLSENSHLDNSNKSLLTETNKLTVEIAALEAEKSEHLENSQHLQTLQSSMSSFSDFIDLSGDAGSDMRSLLICVSELRESLNYNMNNLQSLKVRNEILESDTKTLTEELEKSKHTDERINKISNLDLATRIAQIIESIILRYKSACRIIERTNNQGTIDLIKNETDEYIEKQKDKFIELMEIFHSI